MCRYPLLVLTCVFLFLGNGADSQTAAVRAGTAAEQPDQTGRKQLIVALDKLAAEQSASRRAEVAAITTRRQAEQRQAKVRATMLRLIGALPTKTPLNAQVLGESKLPGVRIQKILFDSQPQFHVTALMYLPDPLPPGRLPAIILAPGHGATGKASDFASASMFARNGFAVLSYDPIGQGERLQYPDPSDPAKSLATRPTGEHGEAGLQPVLIGGSLAKYMLWDGMRAVDYLLARPEVDPGRIGAYGCSGGGAMTALLGGLDTRIAAVGTACYITNFDSLLPAVGPQDGEQSTPGWIAAGLDFPDWVEVAAPRPYAMIATASDMFPWAGAKASAAEARRFYALFDPASAGAPTGAPEPLAPTGPTLNADTANAVPLSAKLQLIAGAGGHGNLRPLQAQIVSFFLLQLAHSTAAPVLPPPSAPGANPFALPPELPKDALQVTATGQVATAYPDSASVFSLNRAQAARLVRQELKPLGPAEVRAWIGAVAVPGAAAPPNAPQGQPDAEHIYHRMKLETAPGVEVDAAFYRPAGEGKNPVVLMLRDSLDSGPDPALVARARGGTAVFVLAPRPSPPDSEELKSPILGPFYLLGLRAELVGKTLLGMRVDDVIRAIDFFSTGATEDPNQITAEASGHMALVLLHAAVLDGRLKHVTLRDQPPSYAELLADPMPKDAPQDIVPGVLLHYDTPDLVRMLGGRVTVQR